MLERGFTLFELLISLLILSIVLTVALPLFSSQIQQTRIKTSVTNFYEAVQLTRTIAVSHNQRAVLKHTGSWDEGWEIFVDKDHDGIRDEDETLIQQGSNTSGINIKANRPVRKYISFIGSGESRYVGRANGGGFQAGSFTLCGEESIDGYSLTLARSGRMRLQKISGAECDEV